MKLNTKITSVTLGLALPFSFVSCKNVEKKVADGKESADKTLANVPKSTEEIIGMFNKMNTTLEGVTDLESAKKAIPALESAGTMVKKGLKAIGGEKKLEAALEGEPELMSKFSQTMIKLKAQLDRIKDASPEAHKYIDEKIDAVMK